MFRICKAELKKLFMKSSIFVVTGLLILMLAICSFVYHPNNRNETYIVTSTKTVEQFYNQLQNSSSQSNTFGGFNNVLASAKKFVDSYSVERNLKQELQLKIDAIQTAYGTFAEEYIQYKSYSLSETSKLDTAVNNLKLSFSNFQTFYNENVKSVQELHVLTTSSLDLNTTAFISKCLKVFDDAVTMDEKYEYISTKINSEYRAIATLTNYINQLVPFVPDTEYVSSLYSYITTASERLGIKINADYTTEYVSSNKIADYSYQSITAKVSEWKATTDGNKSTENFESLRYLATCYKQETQQVLDIVTKGIYINALQKYSQQELNGFLGLENVNYYEYKENLAKLNYLFNTNTFEIDYANPFSIDQPSNFKVNAFDFSYYALRLCMFVIIIYVITMAGTTIVGEQEAGTMKMLAIRPYKRQKLLGGKLLAIVLIGLIMLVVSSIATLAIGGISYGFASSPVLFVFNASSAVVVSPVVLYLIMLLTIAFEMIFFILCALAISLLFKSQIASVSISILLYFGTLALNTVLDSASWLKILPFTNINLYKYFGSSFMSTQGALQKILSAPVAVGSSFWLSFAYSAVVMVGLLVLVIEVFKHRDLR